MEETLRNTQKSPMCLQIDVDVNLTIMLHSPVFNYSLIKLIKPKQFLNLDIDNDFVNTSEVLFTLLTRTEGKRTSAH